MNRMVREYGWLLAVAGALLVGTAAFIVALVLGFAPWLNALVTAAGTAAGAWYGLRLTRVMARRETIDSSHAGRRNRRR
jgi:uncharacterized membrane protein YfcA